MDSAQLKRMILEKSESSGIRKKLIDMRETGLTDNDVIEMGNAMELTVQTKGWNFMEAYLIRKCDPTNFLFGVEDPMMRGEARGAINFMHYIDQTIKAKNELLRKANEGTVEGTVGNPPQDI